MTKKNRFIIYLGFIFISLLLIRPEFNGVSLTNGDLNVSQYPAKYNPTIIDRMVPHPAGGRFLVPYILLGVEKGLTFGKYDFNKIDRYGQVENNLYPSFLKRPINHFCKVLMLMTYVGNSQNVAVLSNYLMQSGFLFLTLILIFETLLLWNIPIASHLFFIVYFLVFIVLQGIQMSYRETDIAGAFGWSYLGYVFSFCYLRVRDHSIRLKKSSFVFLVCIAPFTFFVMLLRETTLVPACLAAIFLFYFGVNYPTHRRMLIRVAVSICIGVIGGYLAYLFWPKPEAAQYGLTPYQAWSFYFPLTIMDRVSITERFLLPFLPHLILLLAYSSCRIVLLKNKFFFFFAFLSCFGLWSASIVSGAGMVSEEPGLLIPMLSFSSIMFGLLTVRFSRESENLNECVSK